MKLMDALAFCCGFPRRAFPQVPRRNYYRGPAFGTSANTTADRIDTAFLLPVLLPTPFYPTFRTLYLSFSLHAFTSFFPLALVLPVGRETALTLSLLLPSSRSIRSPQFQGVYRSS